MAHLSRFLKRLFNLPEDVLFHAGCDLSAYYQPWGFTVYRTAYGPSSEQHWQALLDGIRADVVGLITGPDGTHQANSEAQHILSLFRLDARSDVEILNGLNMEQLRQAYKDRIGGQPMNADHRERRLFLLVDDDVVEGHRAMANTPKYISWVQCVELDYLASNYENPRNKRAGPQRYFGWMKAQLWTDLETRWRFSIALDDTRLSMAVWHSDVDF
jgi:hypothetical protein